VRRLEENQYLDSIYYQNYKKYIFLTKKGLGEAGLDKSWPINKEIVLHDLISVNVVRSLLDEESIFKDGSLMLEEAGKTNRPDGQVRTISNKRIAIEIELTQKEKTRIENKFNEYKSSQEVDYVLYIFTKPSVFTAYQKMIDRLDANINPLIKRKFTSKIILMIEPDVKNNKFTLEKASCYFNGKVSPFSEIKNQYFL
jgi:hypothetical protein